MTRLSIVTPCWNSARTLERTIRSVLDQGHRDLEYILVDGGSGDGTLDIIRKYGDRISRWISEKDAGVYDAMNKGLRMATGDWVGIINSDDAYTPGVFRRVEELSRGGGDVLYADIRMMYGDRAPVVYPSASPLTRRAFWRMPVWHPTAFVRREVYLEEGFFREGMRISADYELMLRLFLKGRRFHHCPEVWVEMDAGGLSDRRWKEGKREIRMAAGSHGVFTFPVNALFGLDLLRMGTSRFLETAPVLKEAQKAYRALKSMAARRN